MIKRPLLLGNEWNPSSADEFLGIKYFVGDGALASLIFSDDRFKLLLLLLLLLLSLIVLFKVELILLVLVSFVTLDLLLLLLDKSKFLVLGETLSSLIGVKVGAAS